MDSCCRLGCLHQQEAQQGIALLADVPQPLLASTGVLTRNHPHARADLLAPLKPCRSSDDQHVRQCCKRTNSISTASQDELEPNCSTVGGIQPQDVQNYY